MISKILCATDGTPHSRDAVELAAQLAAKFAAKLTICAVNVAHGGPRAAIIYSWDDDEANRILNEAAKLAKSLGATDADEVALRSRDAAAGIVLYAEENGFDHIVVGTGDKRGMSRLMLGSVAADIASRAHCAVTVAR
jgi:nucleotide-binding universal stress UspA family protein